MDQVIFFDYLSLPGITDKIIS